MPLTGGTGNEIADNTAAGNLIRPDHTWLRLRTNSNISGRRSILPQAVSSSAAPAAVITISSAIDFGANEGVITNVSGQANVIEWSPERHWRSDELGVNRLTSLTPSSTLTGWYYDRRREPEDSASTTAFRKTTS
jgi:hypothetical protein